MENTEQVAASPEIQPNVEAFVGAAIDAYTAYEAYVSPPNTEAAGRDSVNAHIPGLRLVDDGTEVTKSIKLEEKSPPKKLSSEGAEMTKDSNKLEEKNPPKKLPNNSDEINLLPTAPEKIGTGGAQDRAQAAQRLTKEAQQPEFAFSAKDLEVISDAVGLNGGKFDEAKPGQHLADDLRRLEAQGGWPALKARVHDMNKVLEATGSRYELQVQTVPGKEGGPSQRSLSIIDAATGDVSASMPFNRPQLKPDKPQEPLRK